MAIRTRFANLELDDYRLPGEWSRRLCSPALVVYLPYVRENIRRILRIAGGLERWRPHVKTTKIPRVYGEMVRAGLRRFKCATVREAQTLAHVLGQEGVEEADILLAHPLVGPNLARLAELARLRSSLRFSVLCEDAALVDKIDACLGIYVDVNPGMHRTGIPVDEGDRVAAVARRAAGHFRGVHFYDGHILQSSAGERRVAAHAGYERLCDLLAGWSDGPEVEEIVTSGTPAFRYALEFPFASRSTAVHRVSPGTVVFHDLRSEQDLDDLDLLPAAVVFSRVVSHPRPDRFTCDAGSKSIAAEAGDPCAFAIGHPEAEASTPSEEHLPFDVPQQVRPDRGAELYLVPRHVCPTVNLAEQALLVDEDGIEVSEVVARAHDLLA